MNLQLHQSVRGYYRVQVLNSRGEVVEDRPYQPNLVLDQGKNQIMGGTDSFASCFYYCAVGTGTATPAATDTQLGAEVKRTGTYLTGAGNCDTIIVGQVVTLRRTFDFTAEAAPVNYTELGWSGSASAGANLFSRCLISGGTVSVLAGQQLRVVYDLQVTVGPVGVQTSSLTVSGWPVSPATGTSGSWRVYKPAISTVTTSGAPSGQGFFEPSSSIAAEWTAHSGTLSLGDFVTPPSGGTTLATSGGFGWGSYVSGTFTRTLYPSAFSAASFSSTGIRGFRFSRVGVGMAFHFNEGQTKDTLHTLKAPSITVTLS